MRIALPFLCTVGLLASNAAAKQFGDSGTLSPGGTAGFAYTRNTTPDEGSQGSVFLSLEPTLVYFVANDIGVGGVLTLNRISGDGSEVANTTVGIGPSVQYNLRLSQRVSLAPSLIFYSRQSVVFGTLEATLTTIGLSMGAPLLFHFNGFFIGAGPIFATDLSSTLSAGSSSTDGPKTTRIALGVSVGGWLDLGGGPSPSPSPASRPAHDDDESALDI